MTDEDAAPTPPRFASVRNILDGDFPDGTHIVVHGTLTEVTVKTYEQTGQWARGRFADGDDSLEFWLLARAFARTDPSCIEAGRPVAATACVSSKAERPALMINGLDHIEPGVDHPPV